MLVGILEGTIIGIFGSLSESVRERISGGGGGGGCERGRGIDLNSGLHTKLATARIVTASQVFERSKAAG